MKLGPVTKLDKKNTVTFTIRKTNKYYLLTVIELGLPVSESSTRIPNLYTPTDSEYKFHNTGIENWLHIGLNLGSS